MKELIVNGRYYPMWSGFIDKKSQWKRIINVDMGMEAVAELLDIELRPNGEDSAFVTFIVKYKGEREEWGADVTTIGVSQNTTNYKGICLQTTYTGVFILQTAEEVKS